jgi:hypothetical protein
VALIREHARASIAAWTPATDAETLKKTLMTLAIDADIVLDLHCDNEAVLHIYAGTPLAEAIAPLSAIMGSHATLLAYEAGGEPFDEACSRLWWDLDKHFGHQFPIPPACLSTTVELRGEQEVSYELARKDAAGLLQFLTLNGVLGDAAAQAAAGGAGAAVRSHAAGRRGAAVCAARRDSGLHPRAGRAGGGRRCDGRPDRSGQRRGDGGARHGGRRVLRAQRAPPCDPRHERRQGGRRQGLS